VTSCWAAIEIGNATAAAKNGPMARTDGVANFICSFSVKPGTTRERSIVLKSGVPEDHEGNSGQKTKVTCRFRALERLCLANLHPAKLMPECPGLLKSTSSQTHA
jgi:hypothetical protein